MSSYPIPSVVEKTIRGERAVDIYSRLLTDRKRRRGRRARQPQVRPGELSRAS
jgi:hypothetical protein